MKRSLCGGRWARSGTRAKTGGAALILTLAFIVILAAIVLLFLSHSLLETQVSVASADQTAAALFARGAVDSVISELKQEITAGSVATFPPSGSDIRDPNCVFLPATNQAMVPYRMDPTAPANVMKRSAYNEPFYSGSYYNTSSWPAPNWAVNFSSTNPGTSGRYVSTNRWNEALLAPTANPSSTNTGPVATFPYPDWVYATRMNGPATMPFVASYIPNTTSGALNGNCVIGRFAYVVYDEGGLLDVNAAGYPSAAIDGSSVTPMMVRHKISEACADLTQIGLSSSDINALVAWRNPVNAATATSYTNYVYSAATNAFLTPPAGERIFTSRQQLIDFLMQNIATNNAPDMERMQAALPYLTTFSRELNEPCWYPQTNIVSTGYNYTTLATNSPAAATNAFAPLERAASMYTNGSGLVCNPHQPVAFSRFPLSRLAWVTLNGTPPAGVTATQIQQSFGLVWDSANTAWQYVGSTLPLASDTTVQTSVKTLAQISAEAKAREPNFFELLKAAILTGSVNIVPDTQDFPPPNNSTFPNFGGIDTRYGIMNSSGDMVPVPDQQIMQIGLSMIDQASPALLPTRIEFSASTSGDWSGALYGNKNLPYIYKMVFSPYRPITMPLDGTNTQQYFTAWEEPVFMNPYQTVTTNTAPLQIRVRADGTNNGVAGNVGAVTVAANAALSGTNVVALPESCSPELECGPAGSSTGPGGANGASVEVDSSNASTLSGLAANPILLSSLIANGYNPIFNDLRAQSPAIWPSQANADVYTEGGVTYAGFWLGAVPAPDVPDPNHAVVYTSTGPTTTPSPFQQSYLYSGTSGHRSIQAFVLEANYGTASAPNFQEIQRLRMQYSSGAAVEEFDDFTVLQRRLNFFTVNDPRTGRFSFDIMQPSDYDPSAPGPTAAMTSIDLLSPTWTTYESTTNNAFAGIIVAGKYRGITRVPISGPSITFYPPSIGRTTNPSTSYVNSFRWADNSSSSPSIDAPFYLDSDGLQRPADGWWNSSTGSNTLPMREDGAQYRPVMLARPFYSVGELGYVSRDMPWKSLDFSTPSSGDAGLLDFFCVNDGYAGSTTAPVVAGVLNLNTASAPVLQAMLNGADRAQLYPGTSTSVPPGYDVAASDATAMAAKITSITSALPLLNKSEIATRLAPSDPTVQPTAISEPGIDTNIKERREAIVRALASAGQVRTWNLMIDVVAQMGHFPPGATNFSNFIVTAEQRYWAHVAIDRYTGQVVSMQLEPVSE